MSGKNDRNFGGIFQKEMLIYAHALGSEILGLILGRTILCKPTNNPLTTHFFIPKIRVLTYLLSEHNYRKFIGNLSANLKLSFNRGNSTSLINLYLTYLSAIFVPFCYPEGDKKSLRKEGAK